MSPISLEHLPSGVRRRAKAMNRHIAWFQRLVEEREAAGRPVSMERAQLEALKVMLTFWLAARGA